MTGMVPLELQTVLTALSSQPLPPDLAVELRRQRTAWRRWAEQCPGQPGVRLPEAKPDLARYVRRLATLLTGADPAWSALAQTCLVRLALVPSIDLPPTIDVPTALPIKRVSPSGRAAGLLTLAVSEQARERFAGLAGQHVTLGVDVAGVVLRRAYSIVCEPNQVRNAGELTLGVRAQPGGAVSNRLLAARPGEQLAAWPPSGSMTTVEVATGSRALLLGAGSGITPLIAIAADLVNRSCAVTLIVVEREPRDVVAGDLLAGLAATHADRFGVSVLATRGGDGRPDRGALVRAAGRAAPPAWRGAPTHGFICGPASFTAVADEALERLGVRPERRLHETFHVEAAVDGLPRPGGTVAVEVGGSVRQLVVPPGASLLSAAVAEGLDVAYSCLSGVCGSCAIRVVQGAVAPRAPDVLTEARDREGWVLACQAAPAPP